MFTFFVLIFTFSLGSCKKKLQKIGCTDETATNFDAEAKDDDGSCTYNYNGKISFWFNEYRSNTLVDNGVTNLTVYIDDASVGTMNPSNWTAGPECDGANRLTVTLQLGNYSNKNINFIVRDQSGSSQFSGSIEAEANNCVSRQLY